MAQVGGGTIERSGTRVIVERSTALRTVLLVLGITILCIALAWLIHLERTLPQIRAPRTTASDTLLPGHQLMPPGYHDIVEVDAETNGDWLLQEVGTRTWLATVEPGSHLRAAFYGTQLRMIVRIGPEAGRAYLTVDGEPVAELNSDDIGSYVDLWALEASDEPVEVARGLAHGEHVVTVTADEGEVAVSGFEVVAQTPFPWAFVLAYMGIGGALFLSVRQLLYTFANRGRIQAAPVPQRREG